MGSEGLRVDTSLHETDQCLQRQNFLVDNNLGEDDRATCAACPGIITSGTSLSLARQPIMSRSIDTSISSHSSSIIQESEKNGIPQHS